jgi:hypothetical protein
MKIEFLSPHDASIPLNLQVYTSLSISLHLKSVALKSKSLFDLLAPFLRLISKQFSAFLQYHKGTSKSSQGNDYLYVFFYFIQCMYHTN